jgi:glycine cleavage system H protein
MQGDLDTTAVCFQMGLFEAPLPGHLRYSDIHYWFLSSAGRTRIGFSSFASRLLDDVFRLDWALAVGDVMVEAQPIGEIESNKATSELYAPMTGTVLAFNEALQADLGRIGVEPYAAWLLDVAGVPEASLSAEEYNHYLASVWEETQAMLKGQL